MCKTVKQNCQFFHQLRWFIFCLFVFFLISFCNYFLIQLFHKILFHSLQFHFYYPIAEPTSYMNYFICCCCKKKNINQPRLQRQQQKSNNKSNNSKTIILTILQPPVKHANFLNFFFSSLPFHIRFTVSFRRQWMGISQMSWPFEKCKTDTEKICDNTFSVIIFLSNLSSFNMNFLQFFSSSWNMLFLRISIVLKMKSKKHL